MFVYKYHVCVLCLCLFLQLLLLVSLLDSWCWWLWLYPFSISYTIFGQLMQQNLNNSNQKMQCGQTRGITYTASVISIVQLEWCCFQWPCYLHAGLCRFKPICSELLLWKCFSFKQCRWLACNFVILWYGHVVPAYDLIIGCPYCHHRQRTDHVVFNSV